MKNPLVFLIRYLNKYLLFDLYPEEKFQDLAFSALRWIDKINGTYCSKEYLQKDGLWTKFVEFEFKMKTRTWQLKNHARWGDLQWTDERFAKMMGFYKEHFEVG